MTDLQTELATLIAQASDETLAVINSGDCYIIAERLVSAFQQVGWFNGGSLVLPAEMRGWSPVYRFVRPESVENAPADQLDMTLPDDMDVVKPFVQARVERDLARAEVARLRVQLDRAYATLGTDEVADLFVGTDDEESYEAFMEDVRESLAVADLESRGAGRVRPESVGGATDER